MLCPRCGKEISNDSLFCFSCGTKIESKPQEPVVANPQVEAAPVQPAVQQVAPQPVQSIQQPVMQSQVQPIVAKKGLAGWQKGIIIGLLSVVVVLMAILAFVGFGGNGVSIFSGKSNYNSRTVMIYLAGSNLESESYSATVDMAQVDPKTIDLTNTNILIYTGGTTRWHNQVKNTENAIYKLSESGWDKIETYPKTLMNDGKELSKFLTYGYNNYPADQYNLILYDHGNGFQGAILDDFDPKKNVTTLNQFEDAFENSPFNGTTAKLNTIQFRTCLMGNLESASVFSKYAKYMVASEEVIWLGGGLGVFGDTFNGLKASDDEIAFGKKFIKAYENYMNNPRGKVDYPITYSIIDLSKVDKVVNELNKFVSGINVQDNYYDIARARNDIYQFPLYPEAHNSLDLVDAKALVNSMNKYSTIGVDAFNKAFDEAVVYNSASVDGAYGLTVYFPYSASKQMKAYNNNLHSKIKNFDGYRNFVNQVSDIKDGKVGKSYGTSSAGISTDSKDGVTYQLTDEQYEKYGKTMYFLFRKSEDHPNYYQFITNSTDVELTEDKKIKFNIPDKLVYLKSDDGKGMYVLKTVTKEGNVTMNTSLGIFTYTKEAYDKHGMNTVNAEFDFVEKDGKPAMGSIRIKSRDERVDGGLYPKEDFKQVALTKDYLKITDSSGKVLPTDEWETPPGIEGYEVDMNELDESLEYRSMDDGEWYIIFFMKDIDNNAYTSELVKVGK